MRLNVPSPLHLARRLAWLALVCVAVPGVAVAAELSGVKTVTVVTRDHQKLVIGTAEFVPSANGAVAFKLKMNHALFSDHFLSMKEFKCLTSASELSCHVPYPYANPATVSGNDFAWLEHSLLFLFKQPRDFGAKLWNGIYFRMEREGEGLVGFPQAVDLNYISAPSDTPMIPPFTPDLRDDFPSGARWIERLQIQ